MTQVLEELQFSVCALRQDRSAERFHDLLDSHSLTGKLILCGAMRPGIRDLSVVLAWNTKYQTSPKAPIPTGCRSVYLFERQHCTIPRDYTEAELEYLLVISKVVPKIWARTNSAMMTWWPRQLEKKRCAVEEGCGSRAKQQEQLDCCSRGR